MTVVAVAQASGGAPASLDQLIANSDYIVVGTIAGGSASGVTLNLSIAIEAVLKGQLTAGAIVGATGTITEPAQTHALALSRGIFFLSGAQGALLLVPAASGYLDERDIFVALPNVASPPQPPTGTLKEQVMLEVLGAMASGEPWPPGGRIDVLGEYQADPTASERSVFQQWMQGGSPQLITTSLRALLAEGNAAALTRVATDTSLQGNPAASSIFDAVKLLRSTDAGTVALLGQMAVNGSSAAGLRAAAATALAWIHTQQAVPYLAQLLNDPSVTLQAAAVGGLAGFANNVPVGAHEPAAGAWAYRTDDTIAHSVFSEAAITARPTYYLSFWQVWWQTNRAALGY
jgi:hypothetical protein